MKGAEEGLRLSADAQCSHIRLALPFQVTSDGATWLVMSAELQTQAELPPPQPPTVPGAGRNTWLEGKRISFYYTTLLLIAQHWPLCQVLHMLLLNFTNLKVGVLQIWKLQLRDADEHAWGLALVQGRAGVQTWAPRIGFWKNSRCSKVGWTDPGNWGGRRRERTGERSLKDINKL